ncbi:YhbY family RNA-binding protein [Halorhabdus sp. CBA1104]|uniref:YhbY family RNA-binding protein n=1 Tax=unclassified Halorhabdus TaxID=2621901 RepID=UPI0012B41798|nr:MULTISPECIES: YhbY family RNA-binding protein [unclassified Halorhabdus]QGN06436.1 YhbY family RNA-binding protein [Halorhabdus sp. CBA1104]
MSDVTPSNAMHELDVTLWVGKHGVDAVADELDDQLTDRDLVKVKFLRAARGEGDVEALATELADHVEGTVVETRGHMAVLQG